MAIAGPTAVKRTSSPVSCAGNRPISSPHHLAPCSDVIMVCRPFTWDRIITHPRRGLPDAHPRSTYNTTVTRTPSILYHPSGLRSTIAPLRATPTHTHNHHDTCHTREYAGKSSTCSSVPRCPSLAHPTLTQSYHALTLRAVKHLLQQGRHNLDHRRPTVYDL